MLSTEHDWSKIKSWTYTSENIWKDRTVQDSQMQWIYWIYNTGIHADIILINKNVALVQANQWFGNKTNMLQFFLNMILQALRCFHFCASHNCLSAKSQPFASQELSWAMSGCEVGALIIVATLDETGPVRRVVGTTIEGRVLEVPWLLARGRTVTACVIREHFQAIEGGIKIRLTDQRGIILSDQYVFGASISHRDQRARSRSRWKLFKFQKNRSFKMIWIQNHVEQWTNIFFGYTLRTSCYAWAVRPWGFFETPKWHIVYSLTKQTWTLNHWH